jgi:hypothetical protein
VETSVRRFLKDEHHLNDAEINQRLSGGINPLDVVKPMLDGNRSSAMKAPALSTRANSQGASLSDVPKASEVGSIGAKLKAAVVKPADHAEADPSHGVAAVQVAAKDGAALGA